MKPFPFSVRLLDGDEYLGTATQVVFDDETNSFTVMADHAALMAVLTNGSVGITQESGDVLRILYQEGFVKVFQNRVDVTIIRGKGKA